MMTAYYIIIAIGIVLMLIGLLIAIRLKRTAVEGKHKKQIHVVALSTTILTIAYFTTALLPILSIELARILIGIILLLGGIYVLLILWLVRRLLKQGQ